MKEQEITIIPTNRIHPNDYNPNEMDDKTRFMLMRDIRENGFVTPILVHETEPNTYEIIDGEQRWSVAEELGITEIPAIVLKGLTELDRKTATINLDYIHGEENIFKVGEIYKKLREKYEDSEILDKLAYYDEELTNVLEVCDMTEPEEEEVEEEEVTFKFSLRLADDEMELLKDTLAKFKGDDEKEQFISMMTYYAG